MLRGERARDTHSQLHKFPSKSSQHHQHVQPLPHKRRNTQRLNFQSIFLPGSIQGALTMAKIISEWFYFMLLRRGKRKIECRRKARQLMWETFAKLLMAILCAFLKRQNGRRKLSSARAAGRSLITHNVTFSPHGEAGRSAPPQTEAGIINFITAGFLLSQNCVINFITPTTLINMFCSFRNIFFSRMTGEGECFPRNSGGVWGVPGIDKREIKIEDFLESYIELKSWNLWIYFLTIHSSDDCTRTLSREPQSLNSPAPV